MAESMIFCQISKLGDCRAVPWYPWQCQRRSASPAKRERSAGIHRMDASEYHRRRRFARTPFGDIAFVERGSGSVAVFLHG
jgi:hypothetical protein